MRGLLPLLLVVLGCSGSSKVQMDEGKTELKVVHFDSDHVDNPSPPGSNRHEEFHKVRESLANACQKFGKVGPDGVGSKNIKFYLVDDQLNTELNHHIEILDPALCTREWFDAMANALGKHEGWTLGVSNIKDGYVIVFPDRLMVKGQMFQGCNDVDSVCKALRENLFGTRKE